MKGSDVINTISYNLIALVTVKLSINCILREYKEGGNRKRTRTQLGCVKSVLGHICYSVYVPRI